MTGDEWTGDPVYLDDAVELALVPDDAVARIRRALLEEAQDTRDADGPAREEVEGSGGLLHRGVAALFFSERGAGKTTAALAAGMGAALAGVKVLYLDRENGPALTRDRVEAILDTVDDDPLADGRFVGRHYPEVAADWRGDDFAEAITGLGFVVVIFDSLREFLQQLRLDPDKEVDVSAFFGLCVTPLIRAGAAVVLLDNTGHAETNRPKGSGTKLDAAQQAYKIVTTSKFTPVETGRISITCTRSRYGDEDRTWSMRVGGGVFETPKPSSEAPDARRVRETGEAREKFRRAVVAVLTDRSPLGRDLLITAVRERGVKGKNKALRDRLADVVADPTTGIESSDDGYHLTPGPRPGGQGGATPPDPPGPSAPNTPVGGGRWGQGGPGAKGQGVDDPDEELNRLRRKGLLDDEDGAP